jgi:4-hydroxyphenylpyruvate dioxygenase-like putative hemolysin
MTISPENPLGLDGFAFVEFTSPEPAAMKACSSNWVSSPPRPIRPRP